MAKLMQPKTFLRNAEGSIASYNATDILSGTGYAKLYAGTTGKLASPYCFYRLSNITWGSDTLFTEKTSSPATTDDVKDLDIDFDVLINRPTTLQGEAIVNIPLCVFYLDGGGYTIARLRKWNGASETEIALSEKSKTITGTNASVYKLTGVSMTVPITSFRKGEYLRITIEGWSTAGHSGNNRYVCIAHDPYGQTGFALSVGGPWSASYSSTLSVQIPTRIDL